MRYDPQQLKEAGRLSIAAKRERAEARRGLQACDYALSEIIDHWCLRKVMLSEALSWQWQWGHKRAVTFIERYMIDDCSIEELGDDLKEFIKVKIHEPLPPKRYTGPFAPPNEARSSRKILPQSEAGTNQSIRQGQGLVS